MFEKINIPGRTDQEKNTLFVETITRLPAFNDR